MKKKRLIALLAASCIYLGGFSQTTRATVASGNWDNTAIWSGAVLPSSSETPVISAGHSVVYNLSSATFAGVIVNGELSMTASGSHTLQSNKNIVVKGKLTMTVTSYSDLQFINFTSINEDNFVGSSDTVLTTDVGLWVIDTGRLNLDGRVSGTGKTHYVRATGSITTSQSTIAIDQTPVNWKSSDAITIAPTQSPSVGDDFILGFDDKSLSSDVSSASISISTSTGFAHPKVNNLYTAEIMNLTRPVRIEGTSGGRAHVFVKSSKTQTIRDVAFRYLGPRKDINADGDKELVQGRYGLHFHHCEDGSRGSIIENCVMRDIGNHCYVPHASHGILFENNIAYNVTETPYWWDLGQPTHDATWDGNIAAFALYVPGAISLPFEEDAPTFAASGFEMGMGDGNIAKNNIAIATVGDPRIGGGFDWEADNEGIWEFENNLSHNCVGGLRVWQNTTKNHVIRNFTVYNCVEGIFHGAYANSYRYITGAMYNAPFILEAASTHSSRVRVEDYAMDAAGLDYAAIMESSPLDGAYPMLFRNCTITGYSIAGIIDQSVSEHSADIIQSTGTFNVDAAAGDSERLRIQPTVGQSVRKTNAGSTNISNFAPTIWGDGTGLTGEYFSNTDFTGPVLTRVDSYVGFSEWESGVHYSITDDTYSVRWTGQFQPQFTEKYIFILGTGGGFRLWIDNNLVLDDWDEHYPAGFSTDSISLVAGEKYDIKLEYFNEDDHTGMNLYWNSPHIDLFTPGGEYIPQSQLWPDTGGSFARRPVEIKKPAALVPEKEYIVPTFFNDHILVKSSKNVSYELYDLNGRLLKTGRIVQGVNYIPTVTIQPGMVIMKLSDNSVFKLIK